MPDSRKTVVKNLKRTRAILLLFCAAIFLNACDSGAIKTKELPAPPNSSEIESVVEVGPKLDAGEQKIFIFFKQNNFGDFDNAIRKLDIAANPPDVFNFYDDILRQKGFSKTDAPNMPDGVQTAAWKKTGMFGEQIVLVSVIESRRVETNELTGKYLQIYAARK